MKLVESKVYEVVTSNSCLLPSPAYVAAAAMNTQWQLCKPVELQRRLRQAIKEARCGVLQSLVLSCSREKDKGDWRTGTASELELYYRLCEQLYEQNKVIGRPTNAGATLNSELASAACTRDCMARANR